MYFSPNKIKACAVLAVLAFAIGIYTVLFSGDGMVVEAGTNTGERVLPAKFVGADDVTRNVRSGSFELRRIWVNSKEDRDNAALYGTIVEDYGSFVMVASVKGANRGPVGVRSEKVETNIYLPGADFEPVSERPEGSMSIGEGAVSNGKGYYILQFASTATDEWLKSIGRAGVEIIQYVPHNAYFVYADEDAIIRAANHSRVRWIGSYRPEHKLSKNLKDQIAHAKGSVQLRSAVTPIELTKKGTALFDVFVFRRADVDDFAASLEENFPKGRPVVNRLPNNYFNFVRVELDINDIPSIAAMPDVISIEPYSTPKLEDERSSQIVAGNYLTNTSINGPGYDPLTQFGADGTNVTVSVVDDGVGIPGEGGFYLSSLNTVNGPLRGANSGVNGHGHLNATIIAGSNPFGILDPGGYNYGRGVAPRANIVSIPKFRMGYNGTDADVYNDSVSTPGPNGVHALISNNSWGNGLNSNAYNLYTAQFDGFVLDASVHPGIDPIALIFSAGNEGSNGLTQPKIAKNVISVGNSESLRNDLGGLKSNNIDDIAVDSSRGPAADGRVKPDVVAPGTAITGGRSGLGAVTGVIDKYHQWGGGTSQSAAHVTGIAAIFANWWYVNNWGFRPSPSLIKAAIINSAVEMNGENSSAPIPNGSEGWGRPNMKRMLNTGVRMKYLNEELVLAQSGEGYEITGSVADGSKPLRVTLVWSDPPGVADPALVNDLDLTVTVGGTLYKGNVFSNGVSVSGGSADNRNNVENVFLPAGIPTGTSLAIKVTATALNGDGVLNNGDPTDQKYSLVISNYSNVAAPSFYTISGKVVSPSGRGIGGARVVMTDSQGIPVTRLTNPLGYFTFTGVAGGQNYTVNVTSKRYTFFQQTVSVSNNMANLNFVSTSGSP